MISELHGTTFDFCSWQGGTLIKLGLKPRKEIILNGADIIRKHAIGYCKAEELLCRPKVDCIAVMFLKDDEYFWTHLMMDEFNAIFPGVL